MLLMGTKVGMTRVFTEDEQSIPVTAIKVGPCFVTQIRTADNDGYSAVQVAFGEMNARNQSMPLIGHDAKAGVAPQRFHREFLADEKEAGGYTLGETLDVTRLDDIKFVDVAGTSKGKGFQGGMKRWGFKGLEASHGVERKHRSPGSIGGHGLNAGMSGRLKKGKHMAGHMGAERITMRSLDVIRVIPEEGVLLVKGPIPGPNGGMVEIRPATRLYRSKAAIVAAG